MDRIVAVGDVHGAYERLEQLLIGAGLMDESRQWTGGAAHFVSLGDLLDRGPKSRQVMDLLMSLQAQATAAGGQVHVLVGNHELMNLTGDVRDVSEEEYAALADIGGHQAAFSRSGRYGSWLLERPFMIRINKTLFTHGGLPQSLAGMDVDTINTRARQDLLTLLDEGARLRGEGILAPSGDLMLAALDADDTLRPLLGESFLHAANSVLLGADGPLWYRGTAACHALLETTPLRTTLAALGAERVVVGHTPTANREINARMNGAAYIIDTGMLASVYKGNPRVLEITGDTLRGFDPAGAETPITRLPLADPIETLAKGAYAVTTDDSGEVQLEFAAGLTGRFIKLSQRAANRAVAAYRIDRLLGLRMVPATVQREVDGQQGVVMAWGGRPFSERFRMERALGRPNYCQQSSDYALLGAFDALLGKLDRTADNLFYDRRNWRIVATDNHNAFGSSGRLPTTAAPPTLPDAMAAELKSLTPERLDALIGDLLGKREIKAILKRRDTILTWPSHPTQ